jgi:hypothetical protein
MIFRSLLSSLLLSGALLVPRIAGALGWTQPAGTLRVNVYAAYASAERQFSPSGATTHLFYDGSLAIYTVGASAEFGLWNYLTLIGELPVSHYRYSASDSLHVYTRTLTSPTYFAVGARYRLFTLGTTHVSLSDVVHIPPGFHAGIYDSAHPFLSDGFLENIIGIEAGSTTAWGWVEGGVLMHARDEEPVDQMELRAVVGFDARRGATLKLIVDAVRSLAPVPDRPANVEETIAIENYLWIEGQIAFRISAKVHLAASAGFRVWGQHTPALNGVALTLML